MLEKTVKKYLGGVAENLICSRKEKKSFLKTLSADIKDFTADREDIDLEVLSAEFGSPQDVAASFASQMDSSALVKKISLRRAVVFGIVAGIILLVIGIFVGVRCYQRQEFFLHPDGYIAETPVYIVDEEQIDEYFDSLRANGARVY